MKFRLMSLFFMALLSLLKSQTPLESCYNIAIFEDQYFSMIPSIEDCDRYIHDVRNLKNIFSEENLITIVKGLQTISNEISCDSTEKINIVLFHQEQHSLNYLYFIISGKGGNKYFFLHPYKEKSDFLGENEERDYISYVFQKLYELDISFSSDYAMFISFEEGRIVENVATQKFNFHNHFQILSAVTNLLSCDN